MSTGVGFQRTDRQKWPILYSNTRGIRQATHAVASRLGWNILTHVTALEGKIGVAALCKNLQILSPESQPAHDREEALSIAVKLGFPVMLKISRSGSGNGVYKCNDPKELLQAPIPMDKPFLVEKYIEGDLISVEPLFLKSRLVAYSYSVLTYSAHPWAPSLQRLFTPCPQIESILQKLGTNLQMNGFANASFIYDPLSKQHYLFEFDFRPNRWVRYGELVGVDWAQALRDPLHPKLQRPQCTKYLNHFPADLYHAIHVKDKTRILDWIFNRKNVWQSIPRYDKKLLFWGVFYLLRKMIMGIAYRWKKSNFYLRKKRDLDDEKSPK